MKNEKGFTIIEISLVVVILGIMAAFALIKYEKSVAYNELQGAANSLYSVLCGLRPLAFKYDSNVKATFNTSTMQCAVSIDTSNNGTYNYVVEVYQIPSAIKFGISPTDAPTKQPFEDTYWSSNAGTIQNGLQWNWKTALIVIANTRGEYNFGGVYLYSPRYKKPTYFIGISGNMQSIELKKWNGATSTWDIL